MRYKSTLQQLKKQLISIDGVVAFIILANFILYVIILIYSHQHFFTFNEGDKGIMYQMFYNTIVHGDFFYSSIIGGFGIDWGNRYILAFFLPFMYIYPDIPIMFSILSTILLSLGALPVYWLAKNASKSDQIGLLFVILYFLYPSIGWLMLESVKEEIFVLPFLLFAFYFMTVKSYPKSMLFLFLALICKHNMLLVLPMFAIYAYLENYDRKWIFGPIILSAGWFISLIFFIKPFFSKFVGVSPALSDITAGRYAWIGSSFPEIIINLGSNPLLIMQNLVTQENIFYLVLLFIPLCGISLLKPKVLLIGLPIFAQNLFSTTISMKMITWHYVSTVVFVILISGILAFSTLNAQLERKYCKILVIIIIASSVFSFLAFGPIIETMNNMYNMESNEENNRVQFVYLGIKNENINTITSLIKEIPDDAMIMLSSQFGAYLFNHRNLYYHGWSDKPFDASYEYYLLDLFAFKHVSMNTFRSFSYFLIFQQILQRSDIKILYYDMKYIILGTGENESIADDKQHAKLSILGYRFQSGVGSSYYETSLNESVFFSSKLKNSTGYLAYGPYIHLPVGNYTVEYVIKAVNVTSPKDMVVRVDSLSNAGEMYPNLAPLHDYYVSKDVYGKDLIEGSYTPILLNLSIIDEYPNLLTEFRVYQPLKSDLYVKEINIIPHLGKKIL